MQAMIVRVVADDYMDRPSSGYLMQAWSINVMDLFKQGASVTPWPCH
jgi:hypothetical protein